MAHTLSLQDGTTILDLADPAGIHMQTFRPPPVNRILGRVGAYPYGDGRRTTAAALDDATVEIVVHIAGTSTDDVESKLRTLTRMLEAAQRWELTRIGAPVRLAWRRQGATNTSYRVITSVPVLPTPVDPEAGDWLDISTVTNLLTVSFTVILEPTWHGGFSLQMVAPTAINVQPTTNTVTAGAAITGDLPAPLYIHALNTATLDWDRVWIAELGGSVDVANFSGTADADAMTGAVASRTATGTASSLASAAFTMADKYRYPLRCFLRAKVTAGTASKLQLKFVVRFGGETWLETPYQSWSGPASGFWLLDLGSLDANSLFGRVAQNVGASQISYLVSYKTSDGSSVDFSTDYFEVLPYRSLVRLDGMDVRDNYALAYEDMAVEGSFGWPRKDTQAYSIGATSALYRSANRYGRLKPVLPGSTPMFWFNAQSTTVHTFAAAAAAATLSVYYVPCYANGMRGAG